MDKKEQKTEKEKKIKKKNPKKKKKDDFWSKIGDFVRESVDCCLE